MTKLQLWIPGTILAVGCLVNGVLVGRKVTPMQLREPLATVAPVALGIKGFDTLFAKATVEVVGMTSYINRIYSDPTVLDKDTGKPRPAFGLYVGYYDEQRQGKTIHSPKNCLPGGGWEMVENEARTFQTAIGPVTVNRNRIAKPGGSAVVYYWYQGRGRVAHDEFKVKLELLRDAAVNGRTEEALVRIFIAMGTDGDVAAADKIGADLIPTLVADLARVLPD